MVPMEIRVWGERLEVVAFITSLAELPFLKIIKMYACL